jgi:internalin A
MSGEEVVELIMQTAREGASLLDLSHQELTVLPAEIGALESLRELYLEENRIETLPPEIGRLVNLRKLNLENNHLTSLPPEMSALTNLTELNLRGNPIALPPEILVLERQPAEIIKYHLQSQRAEERATLREAKLIVLGDGGAGKTSLLMRLMGESFTQNESTTHGIDIKRWTVFQGATPFNFNIWDFGGQEIFHSTHSFFLTRRSLYLLVLDPRYGLRGSRTEYWLKLIQTYGGDSPVIVALTKSDLGAASFDQEGLLQKYSNIKEFISVSALTGEGVDKLRQAIEHEAAQLGHVQDKLPLSWLGVKSRLTQLKQPYISYEEYERIAQAENLTDEADRDSVLRFLHDVGEVISFQEDPELRETVVLDPRWVLGAVYRILESREVFQSGGILRVERLGEILDARTYPADKHAFILALMEKFEFGFALKSGREFLFPELLPTEQPDIQWDFDDCLVFRYSYNFLPHGVVSRFIVRSQRLGGQGTYWSNGAFLRRGENRALVKADLEERWITIYVGGRVQSRGNFLQRIRQQFDHIHQSLARMEVKEQIPLPEYPEQFIDYTYPVKLREKGEEIIFSPVDLAEISIQILLAPYEPERSRKLKTKARTKPPKIRTKQPETPAEDVPRPVESNTKTPSFLERVISNQPSPASRLILSIIFLVLMSGVFAFVTWYLSKLYPNLFKPNAPAWMSIVLGVVSVVMGVLLYPTFLTFRARTGKRSRNESFFDTLVKILKLGPRYEEVLDLQEENYSAWAARARQSMFRTNTVDLKQVPKSQRLLFSEQFIREWKDLNLVYNRDDEVLEVSERQRLNSFQKSWEDAKRLLEENRIEPFRSRADELTEQFCAALNFEPRKDSSTQGQFYARMINSTNAAFDLKIREDFPFVFAAKNRFKDADVSHVRGLLNYFKISSNEFALLIAFSSADTLLRVVRESVYKDNLIVLDHDQLWEILAAKSSVARLKDFILEQIDLIAVSPYKTGGPVSGKSFFGRAEEEKTILANISDKNYALLANRKMGKTSLIYKIVPQLKRAPNFLVMHVDLIDAVDYKSFYELFYIKLEELDAELAASVSPRPADASPLHFQKLIREIKNHTNNRQLIIVFDEVDALLYYDLEFTERLFKMFRRLSQEEPVRFIFSGTSTIVQRVCNPASPFYNFCEVIEIGPLSESAARDLVVVPMRALNVEFEDEEAILERILSISARLPNAIQWICNELIRRINKDKRRLIQRADLEAVLSSQSFYNWFFKEFIWGEARDKMPLLRLVVYAMWSFHEFSQADVVKEFSARELPTDGVANALRTLEIYSILTREETKYRFTYQEFKGLIEKHEDINALFETAREGALKEVMKHDTIHH